jgi:hypothetical protein
MSDSFAARLRWCTLKRRTWLQRAGARDMLSCARFALHRWHVCLAAVLVTGTERLAFSNALRRLQLLGWTGLLAWWEGEKAKNKC